MSVTTRIAIHKKTYSRDSESAARQARDLRNFVGIGGTVINDEFCVLLRRGQTKPRMFPERSANSVATYLGLQITRIEGTDWSNPYAAVRPVITPSVPSTVPFQPFDPRVHHHAADRLVLGAVDQGRDPRKRSDR